MNDDIGYRVRCYMRTRPITEVSCGETEDSAYRPEVFRVGERTLAEAARYAEWSRHIAEDAHDIAAGRVGGNRRC